MGRLRLRVLRTSRMSRVPRVFRPQRATHPRALPPRQTPHPPWQSSCSWPHSAQRPAWQPSCVARRGTRPWFENRSHPHVSEIACTARPGRRRVCDFGNGGLVDWCAVVGRARSALRSKGQMTKRTPSILPYLARGQTRACPEQTGEDRRELLPPGGLLCGCAANGAKSLP